jgi:hypothetical protein
MTTPTTRDTIPVKVKNLSHLENAIIDFDAVLERIRDYFPKDSLVGNLVALARNDIFRVQQAMHGLDIKKFCGSSSPEFLEREQEKEAA